MTRKDNPHVHIIYNVVDDEGRPLDEHNFFIRNKQVCRDITIRRNYAWGKEKAFGLVVKGIQNGRKNEVKGRVLDLEKQIE